MPSKYNYFTIGIVVVILFIVYILYILYRSKVRVCVDCNVWNHIDAKSKCKRICEENNKTFSGKWSLNKKNPKESLCECN
jgi:hypothetical protein